MVDAPLPPQNLDAEESVLGAMLLSSHAISAVAEIVQPADFYRETHGLIFRTAVAMSTAGQPVDAITLTDELERQGKLEVAGGRGRIHELAALVPATANAGHYARIVREMAVFRALIRIGTLAAQRGYERAGDPAELVEKVEGAIFGLSQGRTVDDLEPVSAPLQVAFKRLEQLGEHGRAIVGLPTGFARIDDVTSGLQPGNLVLVAARPSMGKSAMCLGVAAQTAIHGKLPVALFTLEMSRLEVTQRLLTMLSLVDSQRIRNGRLDSAEWGRLHAAGAQIDQAPLYMDDSGALTMVDIRAKARRFKMKHPDLALVIVDYIQLMTGGVGGDNRNQELSVISRALKVLARELDVPVLALSQLSRAVEQRHDKRPILSDLRDSGSLEQDADVVMFLYRDEYYNPEAAMEEGTEGIAEVHIAKHRNGPTETCKLAWVKRYARFSNLALAGDVGSS